MNVPAIVYRLSQIFAIISLGIEIVTAAAIIISVFSNDINSKIPAWRELFKSGERVRNSALCFLVLLFFIANHKTYIAGTNILTSISNVCKLYASGSIVVFVASVLISIIVSVKNFRSDDTKKLCGQMWKSATWSMTIGYVLAYFFYLP